MLYAIVMVSEEIYRLRIVMIMYFIMVSTAMMQNRIKIEERKMLESPIKLLR
jgi:hypothetical protein